MLTFLEINGINLKFTDNELVKIGLSLASGQTTLNVYLIELKHMKKQAY